MRNSSTCFTKSYWKSLLAREAPSAFISYMGASLYQQRLSKYNAWLPDLSVEMSFEIYSDVHRFSRLSIWTTCWSGNSSYYNLYQNFLWHSVFVFLYLDRDLVNYGIVFVTIIWFWPLKYVSWGPVALIGLQIQCLFLHLTRLSRGHLVIREKSNIENVPTMSI